MSTIVTGISLLPDEGRIYKIRAKTNRQAPGIWMTGAFGEQTYEALQRAIMALQPYFPGIEKRAVNISVPTLIDGPSCGLPLFLALYSCLAQRKINPTIGFTGALSEQGDRLIEVGGLQRKVDTAHKAKLKAIVFPQTSYPLSDATGLSICPISTLDEAIKIATHF